MAFKPLSLLLGIFISFSHVLHTAGPDDFSGKLKSFPITLDRLRKELLIPAIPAAVFKDGKIVWAKGFGYSDIETKIPATENTPYMLASLTKPVAGLSSCSLWKKEKSIWRILSQNTVSRFRMERSVNIFQWF